MNITDNHYMVGSNWKLLLLHEESVLVLHIILHMYVHMYMYVKGMYVLMYMYVNRMYVCAHVHVRQLHVHMYEVVESLLSVFGMH